MSKTNALRRLKKALDGKYETQQASPTAGAVGDGKLYIGGQLYDGAMSGVAQVVNTGRPAAAQYAAKTGGQVIVRSSGGSGTTTGGSGTDVTALSLLTVVAESALTNDRYLDVSSALTKTDGGAGAALTIGMATPPTLSVSSTNNADTGSHAITSSSAPGAAASLLASSAAGLLTLPNFTSTVSIRTPLIDTASGGLTLSPSNQVATFSGLRPVTISASTGNITKQGSTGGWTFGFHALGSAGTDMGGFGFFGITDALTRYYIGPSYTAPHLAIPTSGNVLVGTVTDGGYKLDVTGTARITTSLTTPLLTTATNVDLVINPAGTGAVQFPNDQTLRTSSFDSSFPINGWQINEVAGVSGYSALTIGKIQADELAVRVFVADEVRVDRGDEFWTKSYGIIAATFTTPSSIGGTGSVMFEDSPALAGAIFTNNDWVLIRKLDIDTGITLSNIWGQVATYVNNSDGTQNWTFTLRSGPTSESVTKGSLAIDFGASGAALIHLSVIDSAGAPYIKMRKWAGANPYTPANFTTYVQLGHLGSTGNAYVTPAGFGLYARSTSDDSRFILSDDNGLQIRGAAFKMYNSTLQTVDISATNGSVKLGTDISSGATTSFDFNGATGDLSITGDLHTADVYLTQAEGILLNTGTTDDYVSGYNTKSIQWFSDIDNPTGNALVTLAGAKATNDVYANLSAYSSSGIAKVRLIADSDVASTTDSQMYLRSQTGGNSIIYMFSDSISLQGVNGVLSSALSVSGDITVSGNVDGVDIAAFKSAYDSHTHSGYLATTGGTLTGTLTSRAIAPSADNTYDLGASGARWQDLYAVNLHVDTIVGTPSYSHSHAAGDITSGTLDFARIPTAWTSALTLDADSAGTSNYVRWLTQTSTGKAWDLIGRAHDYATAAQQNDLLLTYYDGSTIHVAFQADSATRIIDFGETPTVDGTAVVLTSRTVTAGSGMTGGGALSGDIIISHADTSTQSSVDNSSTTVIQDVTLDTYGHVTALGSVDISTALDSLYVNTGGDTMTGALTLEYSSARLTIKNNDTAQYTSSKLILQNDVQDADTHWYIFAEKSSAGAATGATTFQIRKRNAAATVAATPFVVDASNNVILNNGHTAGGGTNGNVGIKKTPSSSYALDVNGSMAASTSVLAPTVTTASGNLTLTSVGGTVAVTGALTGSSTAAFATSVSAPTVTTASGTLTIAPANSTTSVTGALSLTDTLSSASWGITSGGAATLVTVAASTSVTTPTVTTSSGNLTLTSVGGTVAVTGALTGSSTATFTTSVSTPTITNAGALTMSPTGNITLTPGGNVTLVNTATLGSNDYASRVTGWRVDGAGGADFRTLYVDEMHAKTFIADLEQALAGLQIIAKSVAVVGSDFVVPYAGGAQTLVVRDLPSAANMATFQANDIIALRSFSRAGGGLTIGYAWGAVTSYADGSGTQSWLFTRSGTTTYNAITMRGTATVSSSSSATSRSAAKPTGVTTNDILIAVVTYDGTADVVTASGWTEIGSASGADINAHIFYKVAGASEGSSYTFSVVNSHAIAAAIAAYYNVDTTTPIDDYAIQANAAGASMPAPAVWATSTAGNLIFLGGISNNTAATPPAGATEIIDSGSTGIRAYMANETLSTSGNHTKTATISSSSYTSVAASVILRPTYSSMTSTAGAITPGTVIAAESLALDFGVSGNGFHEINAVDGTYGANAPYSQVVTWTTHPATGQTVRTRTGNLYGLFAQANEYGFYAGSGVTTADNYIRLSSYTSAFNNIPLSIYESGTKKIEVIPASGLNLLADNSTTNLRQQVNWFRDLDSKSATPAALIAVAVSGTQNTGYFTVNRNATNQGAYMKLGVPTAYMEFTETNDTTSTGTLYSGGWTVTGNVGLGIASSTMKLDINGNARVASGSSLYVGGQTNSSEAGVRLYFSGTHSYIDSADGDIIFRADNTTAGTERMRIKNSGGVEFADNIGTNWTVLSYGSGWADYGGGYQGGQYKKVGDLVFLRGLVGRTSGSGTTIATLPTGYRPQARCLYTVHAAAGTGRVDVEASGVISLMAGTATYIQLDGLVFSTYG